MNAQCFYFSATGTTRKIVTAFSEGLDCEVRFVDMTKPENRENIPVIESDLVIIAVPIHGERIHRFIYDYLKRINGMDKPLVVLSIYGNMGVGISLAQFAQYAKENHFQLIGAGTFIGEHTYSEEKIKVACGRPDENDLEQANRFGKRIREKLDAGDFKRINIPVSVLPGFISKFPDSGIRFLIKQPCVNLKICNCCGVCAKQCPMMAIDPFTYQIDEKRCIRCYACVRGCPKTARRAEFRLKVFGRVFHFLGRKWKENQIYL
jgi:ferredoxin